jgi:uncharacterized protein (TIGR03435 family)
MNRMASLLIVLIAFAAISPAESFDVVSIREIPNPESIKSGEITYRGGNLYMNGVTLGYAVQWAFDIQNYQLEGPEWIHWRAANDQPRFNIFAKTDARIPRARARLMAQRMLAQRFGLVFQIEERIKTGYSLHDDPHGVRVERIEANDINPAMTFANNTLEFRNMNMTELCGDIALSIREPVVDRTTLGEQMFNAKATVIYESREALTHAIFSGLKRDMGIVAVRGKVPVKTVVVVNISRTPTEN